MQWRWGMGPLLGLAAWAGFAWAMGRLVLWGWATLRRRPWVASPSSFTVRPAELILLAWAVPFFLTTGSFYVKFMRYLQPLAPFLMIYAAAMLLAWQNRLGRRIVAVAILIVTGLYALSFVNLYRLPHPWITASQWIYANVRPGTLILSEQWDDALPDSLTIDGVGRQRSEYRDVQLTWLTGTEEQDDEAKLAANLALLAEAEYLTLVTNRIYGVAPRLPELYPISSHYHQLLFDGSLGYEPVFVTGRAPGLAGFHLRPDTFGWPGLRPPAFVADYLAEQLPGVTWGRADESFLVYDQPLTIIFRNSGRLTAEEMGQWFELD
jgi:hypothetical protein